MIEENVLQSTDNAVLSLEQQLEQLAQKVGQCVTLIEELKLEKQILTEQVDSLNERNKRMMDSMQDLVTKLDTVLCQNQSNM